MNSEQSTPETNTVDLVLRAQQGVETAREELFSRYGSRVLCVVRMRLGAKLRNRLDSMDIAQEAMVDALGRLDNFSMRDESSLMRWLAVIVENKIRNQAAFHGAAMRDVGAEVSLEAPDDDSGPAFDVTGGLATPSVEVGRAEEIDRVREAIASLPERYRETILLRDYTGASWKGVAEELGIGNADAARAIHSRALSKLGEKLRLSGLQ